APYMTKTVTAKGPVVTLRGLEWSSRAANCCGDIKWTQTSTWSAGKFRVGATKRDRTPCSDTVNVGPNTICTFALRVESTWQQSEAWKVDDGVTVDIDVYNPTTKTSYPMHCKKGMPTACRGGNGVT